MKILDSQGRLFGKVSILDLVPVILLVLVGIFLSGYIWFRCPSRHCHQTS